MKTNVSHVVSDGLCMGCGICQDACAKKCIRITMERMLIILWWIWKNAMNVDYV